MRGVARAAASIPAARDVVKRLRPDVVLSVGGYAGGPVALAARTLGVPVALLEPNSILGLSNRLLSPIADRAYTAFPEVERRLRPSVTLRAGVPLRRAFAPVPYAPKPDRCDLLVIGGSLGAMALNEIVPRAVALARQNGVSVSVVHQTGRDRQNGVRALYGELGIAEHASVVDFIDDVARALASADVVIARSGASACAELCAVGRAGLFIPYPYAADDHQLKNARSLERAGAAVALPQAEATVLRVAAEIERLVRAPELRSRMAAVAASLGKPDAAARVAEDLLKLARAGAEGCDEDGAMPPRGS
jgi:UDP-N-acetylglucosamine--N-acetylmuramyl-(pentapeptide) pyrophosphoryl-undecaprenol N-acetylglucosamine transferase